MTRVFRTVPSSWPHGLLKALCWEGGAPKGQLSRGKSLLGDGQTRPGSLGAEIIALRNWRRANKPLVALALQQAGECDQIRCNSVQHMAGILPEVLEGRALPPAGLRCPAPPDTAVAPAPRPAPLRRVQPRAVAASRCWSSSEGPRRQQRRMSVHSARPGPGPGGCGSPGPAPAPAVTPPACGTSAGAGIEGRDLGLDTGVQCSGTPQFGYIQYSGIPRLGCIQHSGIPCLGYQCATQW